MNIEGQNVFSAGILTVYIVTETGCRRYLHKSCCRNWRICCTKTVRTLGPKGRCMNFSDPVKGGCTAVVMKDFFTYMWTCWYAYAVTHL